MPDRFEKRLEHGPPVVTDGGMGVLVSSAVPGLRCPEEANIRAPESVVTLHASFITAGAELIETNTFGANRHKLRSQFLDNEVAAINEAGVKLAREAREISGRDVFVAGSIGPLGELGGLAADERGPVFAEQAALLEGRGVDLFMVETFFDLDELTTAIEAVQGVSSLPIVAMLTFDEDAETFGGVSAHDAVERLAAYELAAVGANHGAGLHAAQARALGARVIGGCCGTTPTEIAAIARAVEEERQPTVPFAAAERELVVAAHERPEETELARRLHAGEWVTCVELDPPKGGSYESMLAVTRTLNGSGAVGFVDINDNPMARARANALMAAIAIERSCAIETIPHVTPRDTSVMGLQSQLLAAHAEGVRNVLAVTGDPPHVGDYPGSRGVYDVDSIGLAQMVSRLNGGEDFNGKAIDGPTSFFLGVAVNPSADDLDTEVERFRRKVDAGAQFAMTQALFDLGYLDRFEELVGGWPIPILVGIFMVRSHQLAVRLHNEVPGIVVPEEVQNRLREAGPRAAEEGLALARELYAQAREKAAGVYVIPPFKQPEAALELLGS